MVKRHPILHALLLAALLRLPLLWLPGPGRDEAAYHYWAWHPELFYAPLLQWMLRLSEILPLPAILTLRLPSLVAGALVLILVDLRLRRSNSPFALRWICLLALVVSEWQTYTGAILHPDQLLVASILFAVLAAREGRVLLFALALCLASLAKPTGLLFLPVGWVLVGRISQTAGPRRIALAILGMSAALVLLLSRAEAPMLEAMAQFGRTDAGTPWALRIGGGLVAVLISGGPLLLLLAAVGLRERVSVLWSRVAARHPQAREAQPDEAQRVEAQPDETQPNEAQRREAWSSLAFAAVLLAAFGLAALLRGQIKANWVLPAAVLLLPLHRIVLPRWLSFSSLCFGLIVSLITVQAHRSPESFQGLEDAIARGSLSYERHVGTRESEVSPTSSWVERLSEYRDLSGFSQSLERGWAELGAGPTPRWLVSDDYGLACQILWYRHNPGLRLVVPRDGIYHRELSRLRQESDPGPLLLLGTQRPVDELWTDIERMSGIFAPPHPITGEPVQIAVGRRRMNGPQ